jgi:hypothetical protein
VELVCGIEVGWSIEREAWGMQWRSWKSQEQGPREFGWEEGFHDRHLLFRNGTMTFQSRQSYLDKDPKKQESADEDRMGKRREAPQRCACGTRQGHEIGHPWEAGVAEEKRRTERDQ